MHLKYDRVASKIGCKFLLGYLLFYAILLLYDITCIVFITLLLLLIICVHRICMSL